MKVNSAVFALYQNFEVLTSCGDVINPKMGQKVLIEGPN